MDTFSPVILLLKAIAALNECLHLFNVWIISPTGDSQGFDITTSALLYGIAEPFFAKLIIWIPVEPMTTLTWFCASHALAFFISGSHDQTLQVAGMEKSQSTHNGTAATTSRNATSKKRYQGFAANLVQTLTAAASDANLSLMTHFTDDKDATTTGKALFVDLHAALCCLMYLSSKAIDWNIAKRSDRPRYFGEGSLRLAGVQVLNLLALLGLRILGRWMLDLAAFETFSRLSEEQHESLFLKVTTSFWLNKVIQMMAPTLGVVAGTLWYDMRRPLDAPPA